MAVDDELRREVNESMLPVAADVLRALKGLYDALGGAAGIAQLEADRAQWEADHPGLRYGQSCHCFCGVRHGGGGMCAGDAVTFEVRVFEGAPLQVPMCKPCADATDG